MAESAAHGEEERDKENAMLSEKSFYGRKTLLNMQTIDDITEHAINITSLPQELLILIFIQIGMRRLILAASACADWRDAAQETLCRMACFVEQHQAKPTVVKHPCFLASIPSGQGFLCTEALPSRLQLFSHSLVSLLSFGGRSEALRLTRPTGLVATDDAIYVADCERGQVQRFGQAADRNGAETVQTVLIPEEAVSRTVPRSWAPYGLTTATLACGARLLFISDSRHHRIVVLRCHTLVRPRSTNPDHTATAAETYSLHAAVGEHGEGDGALFDHPRGLAVHHERCELIVCDRGNDRLHVFKLDQGTPLIPQVAAAHGGDRLWHSRHIGGHGCAPGRLIGPYAVAFASSYTLMVVSEFEGRRVQVLTASGAPLQILHLDSGPRRSSCPTGLACCDNCPDGRGRMHIADFASGQIHTYLFTGGQHADPPVEEDEEESEAEIILREENEILDLWGPTPSAASSAPAAEEEMEPCSPLRHAHIDLGREA